MCLFSRDLAFATVRQVRKLRQANRLREFFAAAAGGGVDKRIHEAPGAQRVTAGVSLVRSGIQNTPLLSIH